MEETPIKSHRFSIHFHSTELRHSFAWVDPTPLPQNFQEFSDRAPPFPIDGPQQSVCSNRIVEAVLTDPGNSPIDRNQQRVQGARSAIHFAVQGLFVFKTRRSA
jgi:hypothetical protein